MSPIASFFTTALSALASITVFVLGALLILAYVLVTAIVGMVRWSRAHGRRIRIHRRHDAAVPAPSR
jgi:hypothetical protein